MACQSGQLFHCWVLPYIYLILWIPVSADKFVHIFGEDQVANLTACVNWLQRFKFQCVPELNGAVLRASTGCEEAMFVGWPRNCFHCCLVLAEACKRLWWTLRIPNKKLVVIASRSKLLLIMWPFQATYFLPVPDQFSFVIIMSTQVAMQNGFITTTSTQEVACPRYSTDTPVVAA